MTKQERLKELLTKEFIPDLEEFIDEIFETITENSHDTTLKQELEESQEVLKSFKDIVKDIEGDALEDEECIEILAELEEIKKEYEIES